MTNFILGLAIGLALGIIVGVVGLSIIAYKISKKS